MGSLRTCGGCFDFRDVGGVDFDIIIHILSIIVVVNVNIAGVIAVVMLSFTSILHRCLFNNRSNDLILSMMNCILFLILFILLLLITTLWGTKQRHTTVTSECSGEWRPMSSCRTYGRARRGHCYWRRRTLRWRRTLRC